MAKNDKALAVVPVQDTALAPIDAELLKYAQDAAGKEKLFAGKFLSPKGGVLTLDGQALKNNEARVVVLGAIFENTYFEEAFDPDNRAPPACYAFSEDEETLAPHAEAEKPQHMNCATCKWNRFGTARKGTGKACQNRKRLALIAASDLTPEGISKAEVVYFRVPVTSVKAWSVYVKGLAATMKRPPFAMVTRLSVVPDAKTQIRVVFEPVEAVPNEAIPALLRRVEEQKEAIGFPYPKASEVAPAEEAAPKAAAKGKGKF